MTDSLVYLGNVYPAAEFERQFNPRLYVDNADDIQPRREKMAAATRAMLPHKLGVAYGTGEREVMDIFPAGGDAPCLVYLHGGFWRMGHARENNYAAEAFAKMGAAVFMPTYDLCPSVTIAQIADQAKRALAWVHANAAAYGGDPNSLYLCGHSAGAHLFALALADGIDGVPDSAILGACLISGIYDLEPVQATGVNEDLRIEDADIYPLSPLNHPPTVRTPLVVSWGEAESDEWRRQSKLYASVARSGGAAVEELPVPGADHYSIAFDLVDPAHPPARVLLSMMELG